VSAAPPPGLWVHDRYADRLHDLLLFVSRDPGVAAAVTRDAVVMAAAWAGPEDPADEDDRRLRARLYAQARTEVSAVLITAGQPPPEERVVPLGALPPDPADADLAAVVYEATAAYGERDLALLALHLRHGLEGPDLAAAMGLSPAAVEVLLPATLDRVDQHLRVLLALVRDRRCCPAVAEVAEGWDGTFSPLVRRRAAALSEEDCGELSATPSPLALLRSIPPTPAPTTLRQVVEERLHLVGALPPGTPAGDDATVPPGGGPPALRLDDDDATVPPGEGPPVIAAAAVPPRPAADPGPPAGPGTDAAPDEPAPVATAAGAAPAGPPAAPAHRRVPVLLAAALGIAAALAVAAAVFRLVAEPERGGAGGPVATAAGGGATGAAAPSTGAVASSAAAAVEGDPAAAPAGGGGSGTLTVPPGPVVLAEGVGAPIRLSNPGDGAVGWQVESAPAWARLDRASGRVEPGAAVEVGVRLVEGLAEGDHAGEVVVRWDGRTPGRLVVPLDAAVDRLPRLAELLLGSRSLVGRGCGVDRTEVAVTATDESRLAEVAVLASGPAAGTTTRVVLAPDPATPGRHVGVLGPFDGAGEVVLQVVAADVRGNLAEADGGRLAVTPCPGG
jgi:hypothetical protein